MKRVIATISTILICVGSWVGLALTSAIISIQDFGPVGEIVNILNTCSLVILFWVLLWNAEDLHEWFLEKLGYYKTP